ncbi:sugar ABC transporter ATP-binding protein [Niveibacterium sp. SC-1]|uniref:sugar ABC transporter ATP-binding protein n=1 Tax=Niveibacterium sp. SC-1 TaxID=3135646 RepID=UPI00311F406F
MNSTVLAMRGISKRFGGTHALRNVNLTVRSGEIHALMGENGAGKSTLMKVLSGVYQPDTGRIEVGGKAIAIHRPADARAAGINLIYQELSVASNLSVAENIFMGSEPRNRWGMADTAEMNRRADVVLRTLDAPFSATTRAHTLSIAQQQQVEIARALVHRGRILIMDEPTAALSDRETEALFRIVRKLRDDGIAVIYISHRMAEVNELADSVTVLRDGSYVGELERDELTHAPFDPQSLVQMMVGRDLGDFYQHRSGRSPGRVVLEVEGLCGGKVLPSSFSLCAGEVLGLAGLVGAGRTELARLVFGADRKAGGAVRIDGTRARITHPLDAIRLGVGYVPEDRKGQGLFLQLSALANTAMNTVGRHSRLGVIDHKALHTLTERAISRLSIKVAGPAGIVGGLSGGNQQKVLLARWLEIQPRILILDEPTRGVDIGAKTEIYRIINELACQGVAVIVISSELPEVIATCDRVLVMREGRIAGECQGEAITQENIMTLATRDERAAA